MSWTDVVLIGAVIVVGAVVLWPLIDKDLDMRSEEWLRNPANVKKLGDIANARYARAYYGGY